MTTITYNDTLTITFGDIEINLTAALKECIDAANEQSDKKAAILEYADSYRTSCNFLEEKYHACHMALAVNLEQIAQIL